MATLSSPSRPVEKANYHHLVMDIAWFGLALAATTRFLQFYALQMGATAMDLGWLTAIPALVLIFATTLSQWWRNRYSDSVQAVWLPGVGHRFLFLLPAFAPFFPAHLRVPWIIFASTLPTIAQGVVASVFVVMMRETISDQRLQPLLARRHMAMNLMLAIGAGGFGLLLTYVPFPVNYQIMFLAAFGFSMLSQWHLGQLHVLNPQTPTKTIEKKKKRSIRAVMSDSRFQSVALITFVGYITYHVIISVIPLHLKNDLRATESFMGLYGAIEVAGAFGISFVLSPAIKRFGNRGVTMVSLIASALSALIIALATNLNVTLIGAALTGASWSAMTIAIFGFFAERTEKDDIQAAMLYHQIAFAAIFIGPLLGSSLVTNGFSVVSVMLLGVGVRFVGALVVHWGLRVFGKARVEPMYNNPLLNDPNEENKPVV
jgi:MFS family permease